MDSPPITPSPIKEDSPIPKKDDNIQTKPSIIEDCLWLTGC